MRGETVQHVSSNFDYSFWTVDVLQATQAYPAIWHAGLAMAAMHQRHRLTDDTAESREARQECYRFALVQYNTSIKHLIEITSRAVKHLTYVDQQVVLLASVLYVVLCGLQGDTPQAISHAKNGLQLFYSWRFWEYTERHNSNSSHVVNPSSIVTLLSNVEGQFANRLDRFLSEIPRSRGPVIPFKCSPKPFASITEGNAERQNISTPVMNYYKQWRTVTDPVQAAAVYRALRYENALWHAKWVDFERSQESKDLQPQEREAMLAVRLAGLASNAVLRMRPGDPLSTFDKCQDIFTRMVDIADQVRQLRTQNSGTREPSTFAFSSAVTERLRFVAMRANKALRLRAIDLLENWPIKEGFWDPKLIAAMCREIMTVEQEAALATSNGDSKGLPSCPCVLGSFICEDHRIEKVEAEFMGENTVNVTFRTVVDSRLDVPSKIVILSC